MRFCSALITLLIFMAACKSPAQRNEEIPANSGKEVHISNELKDLYKEAGKLEFLRSFLVWRDSSLIAEQYFQPYSSDSLDHVRSVTKSIISILVGIAIDKELILSVNDPVEMYIGNKLDIYSQEKKQITIKDLLTMSAGFQWNESNNVSEFNAWASSLDPLHYLFSRELVAEPGKTFNYNSGEPHILSIIISEVSGMSTMAFAKKNLFEPLGIDLIRWRKLRDGYYSGGASLEIAPSDLLKVGVMMLNKGMYEDKRIVSTDWVESSVKQHMVLQEIPDIGKIGYGYLWWINDLNGIQMFQGKGYGGQYLVVIPNNKTVVTITSQWRNLNGKGPRYITDLDKVLAKASLELLGVQIPH